MPPRPPRTDLLLAAALLAAACDSAPRSQSSPPTQRPAEPNDAPTPTTADDDTPPAAAEAPADAAPPVTSSRPEAWPAPLPWADDVDLPFPDYIKPEASPAGDHRVRLSLPTAPIADLVAPWREAFAAAGFAELEPCAADEATSTFACTYRSAERLAHLDVRQSGGSSEYLNLKMHLLPAGHAPLTDLPGRCVTPPEHSREVMVHSMGIGQDGETFSGDTRWSVSTHRTIDLDGDGRGEVLVPHKRSRECPWETPHDLYIMRGDCGHRIGTITGFITDSSAIAPFTAGLREFTTESGWADHQPMPTGADDEARRKKLAAEHAEVKEKTGRAYFDVIPSNHTRTRTYRFDGAKLELESDNDSVGRCHHCATSRCSSR